MTVSIPAMNKQKSATVYHLKEGPTLGKRACAGHLTLSDL